MPLPARLLFLLLFAVVLLSSATASPVAGPPSSAATPRTDAADAAAGPATRTVVHSWDKLRITVKSGSGLRHGHGRAHAAGDAARLDPSDPGTVLIKAPRRFVPKPNSPTCPDGTDADHKGNCRAYW